MMHKCIMVKTEGSKNVNEAKKHKVNDHREEAVASPGNEVRGAHHEFFLSSPAWDFFWVPRLF